MCARDFWVCRLARELAEKEDAHLTLEEQYSSLQEEVEVKTKKLKKLWNKWQAANREVQDLQVRTRTEAACGSRVYVDAREGRGVVFSLCPVACVPWSILCVDRRLTLPSLRPLTRVPSL